MDDRNDNLRKSQFVVNFSLYILPFVSFYNCYFHFYNSYYTPRQPFFISLFCRSPVSQRFVIASPPISHFNFPYRNIFNINSQLKQLLLNNMWKRKAPNNTGNSKCNIYSNIRKSSSWRKHPIKVQAK